MRYIEKITIEQIDKNPNLKPLLDYIDLEINRRNPTLPSLHPSYDKMQSDNSGNTFKDLKKQLLAENYSLCSFCQENVGTKILVEHLNPQSIFKNQEVDYYNLYLCCQTQGQCSHAKKNNMIIHFLTHKDCATFFKYTWNGEILPNCNFGTWEDCKKNLDKLNTLQLQIYSAIEILGLNCQILVLKRTEKLNENNFRGQLKNNKNNKNWLQTEKAKYQPNANTNVLPEFANMFLYFINEQLKKTSR